MRKKRCLTACSVVFVSASRALGPGLWHPVGRQGVYLKTLYVMDPLDKIDVAGDSTYMLMLEGCRRGGEVAWCTPMDLFALTGRCHARCQRVEVSDEAPYFRSELAEDRAQSEFDNIWLRKDPPFDIA